MAKANGLQQSISIQSQCVVWLGTIILRVQKSATKIVHPSFPSQMSPGQIVPPPPPLQFLSMGHNGHGINLYGIRMILMGNLHTGAHSDVLVHRIRTVYIYKRSSM